MTTLANEMNLALKYADDDLLNRIGEYLIAGAAEAPPGGFGQRAKEWLKEKREWITSAICDNPLVSKAFSLKDEHAIAYAIVLALLPPGGREVALYVWIAVLVTRRGREYWCGDEV